MPTRAAFWHRFFGKTNSKLSKHEGTQKPNVPKDFGPLPTLLTSKQQILERQRTSNKLQRQTSNNLKVECQQPALPDNQEELDDMSLCVQLQRASRLEMRRGMDRPRRLSTSYYDEATKLKDAVEQGLMTSREVRQRLASQDSTVSNILRSASLDDGFSNLKRCKSDDSAISTTSLATRASCDA
eukprot:gnl/MRDRNA2_/MRDRNA2_90469_c0_seq1.p1 gnl/MRDRNA2_/MRDRNA2_90469_c0~~gnl/MRDRNA2_/MRDRNA2_90469_c0_seq1.p1  ORF type:complete len:184 (+),score=36.80 gnl/MRDRNA2_/MRDRNA2_90469_c0_seq1:63-614(+)